MWVIKRETEEGIVLTYCTSKLWERVPRDPVQFAREIDAESVIDFFPEDAKAVKE